jgi:aldehyde:ferredoxin oxidoreductase
MSDNIAYVDLTTREIQVGKIAPDLRRRFLGGRGINTYLLYQYVDADTEPLSPDNVLIIGAGLLNGLLSIGANRINFSAKSPETGHLGDSAMGGFFGPEFRFAGFDHIVLRNRSETPVYLWIHNGEIEFREASHLAAFDAVEVQDKIREELDDPLVQVAALGPAGRQQAAFAMILHGVSDSAGRTGMGAVMGSKNVWAIAVRGTQPIPCAEPQMVMETAQKHYHQILNTKGNLATAMYGTLIRLNNTRTQGYEGGRNHQFNMLESGGENLDADVFLDQYEAGKTSCHNCPTHCKHHFKLPNGKKGGGPEYYGAGGWGSQCACDDWEVILEAWDRCNRYGLDVGSVTAYTGWVMELWEKGFLTEEQTGGLRLEWGGKEAILGVIDQMVSGEGIGGLLAKGWRYAAEVIGNNCDYYLDHVKGLTIECDDVRGHRAQVLGLATASRGADHLRSRYTLEEFALPEDASEKITGRAITPDPFSYEGKEWACYWTEAVCSLADALGICKFLTKWLSPGLLGFDQFIESIEAATGIRMTQEELMEVAERIYTTERLFTVREGLRRESDYPPPKFYKPWTHGPKAGTRVDQEEFDRLLERYYDLHGWDRDGVPTPETLKRLDLEVREERTLETVQV